ncbi:unnamed protein product [Darwinula stevensoni]|uniref:Kinetochore protein NDC80 n=1 Tax=Darwinula stevensoni TaxID=69355 RepID=A0A7R8XA11_9CRUS|nr:unnamed protein product [Darwinula stevensoni]CAG0886241.1 unnamed protein product [Darwinula stevensoni]
MYKKSGIPVRGSWSSHTGLSSHVKRAPFSTGKNVGSAVQRTSMQRSSSLGRTPTYGTPSRTPSYAPSSAGMRFSAGGGSVVKKESRPINDQEFQSLCIQKVQNFLMNEGFPLVMENPRVLHCPKNTKDFYSIFKFLKECALVEHADTLQSGQVPPGQMAEDEEVLGVVFQSVLNSYRSFMATSEETEEEEKEMFCDSFESDLRGYFRGTLRGVADVGEDVAACGTKIARLRIEREEKQHCVKELKASIQVYDKNILTMEKYVSDLETHCACRAAEIQQKNEKLLQTVTEIKEKMSRNEKLREMVNQQKMSSEEAAEWMDRKAKAISRKENILKDIQAVDEICHDDEIKLSKIKAKRDEKIRAVKQMALDMELGCVVNLTFAQDSELQLKEIQEVVIPHLATTHEQHHQKLQQLRKDKSALLKEETALVAHLEKEAKEIEGLEQEMQQLKSELWSIAAESQKGRNDDVDLSTQKSRLQELRSNCDQLQNSIDYKQEKIKKAKLQVIKEQDCAEYLVKANREGYRKAVEDTRQEKRRMLKKMKKVMKEAEEIARQGMEEANELRKERADIHKKIKEVDKESEEILQSAIDIGKETNKILTLALGN